MADDWLMWQLADSAFPAGAFAHSGGLEAAWQHGRVSGGESLAGFVRAALSQAARGSLPFVLSTWREPGRFTEIDDQCNAFLSNHVANRASRAQGQSLLAAAQRVFGQPELSALQSKTRSIGAPTHLAPVFGAVAVALELEKEQVARLFLFCTLRNLISGAVRLGMIGPMEGQSLQLRLSPHAQHLAETCMELSAEMASQTTPILDIVAGTQDRLYSRLFQS
jgi:urease accessory protein